MVNGVKKNWYVDGCSKYVSYYYVVCFFWVWLKCKLLMLLIGDLEFGVFDFYVFKSIFFCINSNIKSKILFVF